MFVLIYLVFGFYLIINRKPAANMLYFIYDVSSEKQKITYYSFYPIYIIGIKLNMIGKHVYDHEVIPVNSDF
jgi:hypothetical protein